MSHASKSSPPDPKPPRSKEKLWQTFLKAELTQLGIQVRLLNGRRQTWPYAQLCFHALDGGKLTIAFSEHLLTVKGRHLEEADDGLRLQSLVYLEENGTRRQDTLGEPEIPENQPAIDSIHIEFRER